MADIDLHNETDPERLRQVAILQDAEIGKLSERIALLAAENEKLREAKQGRLQCELEAVQEHLEKLQRLQFGARSEKRKRDEERAEKPRRKKRSRTGPTPQPKLPRVDAYFELDEPDKMCPECGDDLEEMGDQCEESELIDVVERRFVVKQVRRQKYRCRCGHIEAALGPRKLRGARRYSPEFAIEVATNKYLDHLPLTRQARRMKRQGLEVSSQTLWDQLNRLGDHVETTYLGLREYIRSADVLGMDETTWKMMDRPGSKKWQMWVMRGRGAVWFALRDSRSGKTAADLLGDFSGWIVCDGYKGYETAVSQARGSPRLANCWAHARRKFWEARSSRPTACEEILELIGDLYEVEAKEPPDDFDGSLLEWRGKLRKKESRPILDEMKIWLDAQTVLPRGNFGAAVEYARGRWPRLTHFVDNPRLWIDNNPTERAIRGPVVGRKNFYGARSKRGTEVAAMLYTIFETAKVCGVDPRKYLRRVVYEDIRNRHTLTLPAPIETVLAD
jgi:transposase